MSERTPSTPGLALVAASIACLAPSLARADAFSIEGFGAAGVAEVNARAARADDGTAAFYCPGGLAFGSGARVELTPTLGASALTAFGAHDDLVSPFGFALALDATIPFRGALADRVRFGFGGYFLPTEAAHLALRSPDEPFFPYYDDRAQRLAVTPALGVKVTDGFGVGVGVDVLAGVAGPATVENGASGAPESRLDLVATTTASLHVGARVDFARGARAAFTYRQKFSVPAHVITNAEVAGEPIAVDVDAGETLFDPHTFVLATSFDAGAATFEVDASLALWSEWKGPYTSVHATLPGANLVSNLPDRYARDVASVRAAVDERVRTSSRTDLVLRGGAGFEPSMLIRAQQDRTRLADGDKLLLGGGATLELEGLLAKPLRLGFGANTAIQFVPSPEQGHGAFVSLAWSAGVDL